MTTALQHVSDDPDILAIEQAVVNGDLAKLSPQQRVLHFKRVCDSLGLNPLTQPFSYLQLNGKLVLYARKDTTDQLRRLHKVSITITARELVEEVYVVTARATMPDGRTDESIGAVNVANLRGENLANAYMKTEAKAKRRVTLSIVGLGWLDESEVSSIQGAQPVTVTVDGEIVEAEPDPEREAKLTALYGHVGEMEKRGHSLNPKERRSLDSIEAAPIERIDQAVSYFAHLLDDLPAA